MAWDFAGVSFSHFSLIWGNRALHRISGTRSTNRDYASPIGSKGPIWLSRLVPQSRSPTCRLITSCSGGATPAPKHRSRRWICILRVLAWDFLTAQSIARIYQCYLMESYSKIVAVTGILGCSIYHHAGSADQSKEYFQGCSCRVYYHFSVRFWQSALMVNLWSIYIMSIEICSTGHLSRLVWYYPGVHAIVPGWNFR